jgi:hypothetical protein
LKRLNLWFTLLFSFSLSVMADPISTPGSGSGNTTIGSGTTTIGSGTTTTVNPTSNPTPTPVPTPPTHTQWDPQELPTVTINTPPGTEFGGTSANFSVTTGKAQGNRRPVNGDSQRTISSQINGSFVISLTGVSDPDGDPLHFYVVSHDASGTLDELTLSYTGTLNSGINYGQVIITISDGRGGMRVFKYDITRAD